MIKYLLLLPILAISAFLLMGADVAQAQSSAYSAGDLVKTADRSTVYYFGFDSKRHAFPNEPTYFSWYNNFDGIKIVTKEELASIQLGHNIVVRPGTHLVKIQSDNKVYAVEPYGVLRHIPSEEIARKLYGYFWGDRVIDVNVAFFPDYTLREAISSSSVHPEGTVFRNLGNDTTYIYRNEEATPFVSLTQAGSHRYQERFILSLSSNNYSQNPEKIYAALVGSGISSNFEYVVATEKITSIRPILIDTAQTLFESANPAEPNDDPEETPEPTVHNSYYYYYYNTYGGEAGADGQDGTNGTDGQDGTDGKDGEDGTNGTDGQDGTDGKDGEDGQDGTDGTDGEDGTDGDDDEDIIKTPIFSVGDRVTYLGNDPINNGNPYAFSEKYAKVKTGTIISKDLKTGTDEEIVYTVLFDQWINATLSGAQMQGGLVTVIHESYLKLYEEVIVDDEPEEPVVYDEPSPIYDGTYRLWDTVKYMGAYPENRNNIFFDEELAIGSVGKIIAISNSSTHYYQDTSVYIVFKDFVGGTQDMDGVDNYDAGHGAWIPVRYIAYDIF